MDANEDVLREILDEAAIRYRSRNDREYHHRVLIDELAERGIAAAGAAAIDEFTIRGAVVQRAY